MQAHWSHWILELSKAERQQAGGSRGNITYASAFGILAKRQGTLGKLGCVTLKDVDNFPPVGSRHRHQPTEQCKQERRLPSNFRLIVVGSSDSEAEARLREFWDAPPPERLEGTSGPSIGSRRGGNDGEDRPGLSNEKTEPWARLVFRTVRDHLSGLNVEAEAAGGVSTKGGQAPRVVAVIANNQEQVRNLERNFLVLQKNMKKPLDSRVCILSLTHNSGNFPDIPTSFQNLQRESPPHAIVLVGLPSDFAKLGVRGADVWDGGESHGPGFSHVEMLGQTVVRRLIKAEWEKRKSLSHSALPPKKGEEVPPVIRILNQEREGAYRLCDGSSQTDPSDDGSCRGREFR
uniref:Uncharacterized protein n=1 Tax=Chromera velia CCMP2878 TaxID=1169474 RepID=A0A0G4IER1_9ALVE|eukprot:Cvel_13716.t1-p1 / transcript=Cvel_13716.t1 / gene=Cvel_13716 / organism=Chromera_velia_CCMP2878 / gene_product=hypothetical protein / transcript_product=hypothetical protein / location=Cvel_scaffold948:25559-26915(+) / protein_length=346 / sequence_SO=supercontig / SO=protein_coding / is_pseudo=false